jgi:hypothetical protein
MPFSYIYYMKTYHQLAAKGTQAVLRMRQQKFRNGYPFMINTKELASGQCYMEYPDGRINQVVIETSSRGLKVIRELSSLEADTLRRQHQL